MKLLMKICLWALTFVPLIVIDAVFFPYISGKSLLIRLAIALTSIIFLTHFSFNKFFRLEIYSKIQSIKKNPLVLSLLAFITLVIISTIFALNQYRAFFGDIERGEGLIGLLFFFGFFIFSYLLFEKKDWEWFFRLSLITAFILVAKELIDFSNGMQRPGSFTGNPTFLAGYLLFSLSASWIVFNGKDLFFKYFAVVVGLMSIVGIFVAETRGTILGLFAGIIAIMIYSGVRGKDILIYKKINLQKLSIILIGILIIFSGIFFITRKNDIWQKVPGLNRLAQIGASNDTTLNTRRIALGVSLKAISPVNNGLERFLVGWGLENYSIAYNKYYNPLHYKLEHEWFDRSHNKIMDVLVMNGVFGLVAYLSIWFSFAWVIFKKKGFSNEMMAILFFGSAYLVHILVVFDQISTYIPFFGVLAYLVFSSNSENSKGINNKKQKTQEVLTNNTKDIISYSILGAWALFVLWVLIFITFVPFVQMSNYIGMISTGNPATIEEKIDSVLTPYTYVQENIRNHFLGIVLSNYQVPSVAKLIDKSISAMEDLMQREPYNARYYLTLGQAYEIKSKLQNNNLDYFKKGEETFKKAMALAGMRPDVNYALAFNMLSQGRSQESIDLFRKVFSYDDQVPESNFYLGEAIALAGENNYKEALGYMEFGMDHGMNISNNKTLLFVYEEMMQNFYKKHDKESILIVLKRLEILTPEKKSEVEEIINFVNQGKWQSIRIQ